MNSVLPQKSKTESNKSEFTLSDSTRVLIAFITLLLVSWALTDDLGPLGAMGVALLVALAIYLTSFISVKRKSTHSGRPPLSDSTRVYVSVFMLIFETANLLKDLGLIRSVGFASLFAVGTYVTSFVFFKRKNTHLFRVPMGGTVRLLVSIALALFVTSNLEIGFLSELVFYALFVVGAYMVSFLFFSKKCDTPKKEGDVAGASES